MRMCIYIVILILISCQEYKKQKNDDRYIVFNLYIGKNLASHSITLDFKDKSVFVHNIINEANFDRFVEDEVEVVEGTLPKEAIKQKNDRIDYNTIYELGFIADNKMTTDTNVLFEKIDSTSQPSGISCLSSSFQTIFPPDARYGFPFSSGKSN